MTTTELLAEHAVEVAAFAVRETVREDWGRGWSLMDLRRMLQVLEPDRRWRATAERLKTGAIASGYGSDPLAALANLRVRLTDPNP